MSQLRVGSARGTFARSHVLITSATRQLHCSGHRRSSHPAFVPIQGSLKRLARALPADRPVETKEEYSRCVLLFDVMDTIVWDPFFTKMPEFFKMTLKELFAIKHPKSWLRFERGEIDETQLFDRFFKDDSNRTFHREGLKQSVVSNYRWTDGMEDLLKRLKAAGIPMYVMSNYPVWWRYIEGQLGLSQYLPWTFLSCEGPMKGVRKPEPESFAIVEDHLHGSLSFKGPRLILIDDRTANVEAAVQAGWDAILFKDAQHLTADLHERGII